MSAVQSNPLPPENQTPPPAGGAPRVLARNAACHQCRKRKLKCDATRPICANCQRPRPRANPGGPIICTWDDRPSPSADGDAASGSSGSKGKKRKDHDDNGGKKARLHELEERVAAFEKALQNKEADATYATNSPLDLLASQAVPSLQTGPAYAPTGTSEPFQGWDTGMTGYMPAPLPASTSSDQDWLAGLTGAAAAAEPLGPHESRKTSGENVYELIWPDWPQDLPSLDIVEHVVGVFFDKIPTVPKMFNRASFMNSLQLPPKHPNFPAVTLLHGILGITAPHLPQTQLATRAYFPIGAAFTDILHPERDFDDAPRQYRHLSSAFHYTDGSVSSAVTPMGRFQMWHRRKCFLGLAREFDAGEKLLQAVQAQIIVTLLDAYNAWWTDLWMEAGACIRMAIPLQLNESPNVPDDALQRFRHVLIPPATTPQEQALRDRTWWMAYLTERSVNMSTAWADALHDDEITLELPVTQAVFNMGVGDIRGTQTLHSPDLFSSHPPHHADGLVLYIKAVKLYTDVSRFFRQYGRGSHSVAGYLAHPKLRLFLSQINAFRLSFPPHLRRPTGDGTQGGKGLDVDLISTIMITHAITLALGEPVINKDMMHTECAKMCLSAIRAVLSLLYDINATSFDLSLLSYTASYCWFTCGKGLCRFIDAAVLSGDLVAASVYRSECEVFRMAMQQHGERYPIANRHLKMLDELLRLQAESTLEFKAKIFYDCSKSQVFDPDFMPSANPSVVQGSASGSTPTNATTIPTPTPQPYMSVPFGQAPEHKTGAVPNPAKEFWKDEFPRAGDGGRHAPPNPLGSTPRVYQQAQVNPNDPSAWQGSTDMAAPGTGTGAGTSTSSGPINGVRGISFGVNGTANMSSAPDGNVMGISDMGIDELDISKWFDIPNLSFDESSFEQMMGVAQDSGATFHPGSFAAMFP